MQPGIRVATPPSKPLMVYDGDCGFCKFWIQRWAQTTGDRVEYVPSQDPSVAARFPEIPREQYETAVQLIETDGRVYRGAEAALRAFAYGPHREWMIRLYLGFPVFARIAEWCYRLVASHRAVFSRLTRLGWGRHTEPSTHLLVRRIFLRSLGVIYFIAFVSLWVQIIGLIGSNGILPAQLTMETARQQAEARQLGWERYHLFPTLCWIDASDASLKLQCAAGAVLAALLIAGIAPALCLFLLWLVYLSLATVCSVFLGFQWDILLLEIGFLSIFFAPLQLLPGAAREAPPARAALWLLRGVLFLLMFESGCVKLLSGDPAWRNLTALVVHYETQPLPTWIGWYAHQLPLWFHKLCTLLMFGIELAVPFLIFAPRRLRHIAGVLLIGLQLVIALTGNYCFFNLLTLALCLVLFDDAALRNLMPKPWRSAAEPLASATCVTVRRLRWPGAVIIPLAIVVLAISVIQLLGMFRVPLPGPKPVLALYHWLSPFRTLNSYGLFAVMTMTRPEIIVEGSNDGATWRAYEFKYKAGDVKRRPGFVAPHQPRLDWQMWFAALGEYRHNPWFVNFCQRLLQGSPEVLALLEHNPFPDAPPRYIRATVYEYHFTDFAMRRETGAWWQREFKGQYLPPVSLRGEPSD